VRQRSLTVLARGFFLSQVCSLKTGTTEACVRSSPTRVGSRFQLCRGVHETVVAARSSMLACVDGRPFAPAAYGLESLVNKSSKSKLNLLESFSLTPMFSLLPTLTDRSRAYRRSVRRPIQMVYVER